MSRGKLAFTQRKLQRAIRAVKAEGLDIGCVNVDRDGNISIVPRADEGVADKRAEGARGWENIK